MKYRKLQLEELEELKDNFVRFLASNSIDVQEWESLKNSDPTKVDKLIVEFSDIVFENVLSKVEYLIIRKEKEIQELRFSDYKVSMLGIQINGEDQIDLRNDENATFLLEEISKSNSDLQLLSAEKNYRVDKNLEIFKFMEEGYLISKGHIYESLYSLK